MAWILRSHDGTRRLEYSLSPRMPYFSGGILIPIFPTAEDADSFRRRHGFNSAIASLITADELENVDLELRRKFSTSVNAAFQTAYVVHLPPKDRLIRIDSSQLESIREYVSRKRETSL